MNKIWARNLWAIAVASLVIGCGPNRIGIEGVVTCDGEPLEEGHVSFRPKSDTGGPTAGAEIRDGVFHISAEQGTMAGEFQVIITASHKSGARIQDDLNGGFADVYQQYLPERYNSRSELSATVRKERTNSLRFDLTTK